MNNIDAEGVKGKADIKIPQFLSRGSKLKSQKIQEKEISLKMQAEKSKDQSEEGEETEFSKFTKRYKELFGEDFLIYEEQNWTEEEIIKEIKFCVDNQISYEELYKMYNFEKIED